MIARALRSRSAVVWGVIGSLILVGIWALPAAFADSEEEVADDNAAEVDEPQGLVVDTEIRKQAWIDPITFLKIGDLPLAEEPWFDFATLNDSEIFESGVANLPIDQTFDVSTEVTRHLRSLQAVATVENAIAGARQDIAEAEAGIDDSNASIRNATDEISDIEDAIAEVELEIADVTSEDDAEIAEQARLNEAILEVNGAVAELAIQAFIGENDEAFLDDPDSGDQTQLRVVTDELRVSQRGDIDALRAQIAESEVRREELAIELAPVVAVRNSLQAEINDLEVRIDSLADRRTSLRFAIFDHEDRIEGLEGILTNAEGLAELTAAQYQSAYHERLTAFVAGTDIPLVALNAYVRASRTLASESPSCGVHWSQIAGIARIESIHGYFGDSTLDVNGNTTVDIIGIPLNGTNGTAVIRDSDNGALDGDRVYDRAVGPTQFIPQTWAAYGSDGNEDGVTDPQNIYDAALSTARYLCAAPGTLLTLEGEQAAYWAYNHDLEYSRNVTNAGRRYHERLDVWPESSAFAAFAEQPTLEELEAIEEAERLAEEEAALLAAEEGEDGEGAPEGATPDGGAGEAAAAATSSGG